MSPRLSMLPGVAQVNINGAQKRAVRIKYDLDALAARGIAIEELRQSVTQLVVRRPARLDPHRAPDLHPRDQGRRADRRLFPACGHRLAQRCAGPPAGRRQGRGLRRERGGARRVQRRALDHRLGPAPARRQHRRRHRCDPASCCRSSSSDLPPTIKLDDPLRSLGVDPRHASTTCSSRCSARPSSWCW